MTKKETLDKIKDSLKSLMKFSQEIKEQSFNNFDLTDGTKITSTDSELSVGSKVFAMDDQNNQIPLEDGEYVLTDGTTITVVSGEVSVVSGSETEEENTEDSTDGDEEMKKQKMSDGLPEGHIEESKDEPKNDMEGRLADIESQIEGRLADIESQIESILNIINKLGSSQNDVNEQMMSKIESFSNENGGKAIKLGKKDYNGFSNSETSNFRDELTSFRSKFLNK